MLSMNKLGQKLLAYSASALVLGAFMMPAQAHELRNIGDGYWIQVGDHTEPVPVNQPNNMDIFAMHEDGPGGINAVVPLDRTVGDIVKVHAVGIKLESANYNADITGLFGVHEPFDQLVSEGWPVYTSQAFTPTTVGAIGYIVTGMIQRVGFQPKYFLQKFVCGGGSLDATYGTSFECVTP